MSQSGSYFDGTILPDIETLTGDVGGAVGPDGAFNINILTGANLTTTGNPGTNTITIDLDGTIADTYTTDAGNATPAAGVINVLGGENLNTSGAGATVTIDLDRGTDGQLLIAATGAATAYANLTSADASIVITEGANSIDLSASAMSGVLTLTGDSGGVVSPDGGGDIDLLGGTGIDTVGNPGANSITFNLTGSIATSYQTDSGIATPAGNTLNVLGGENINTAGAGMNLNVHLDRGTDGQLLIAATGLPTAYANLTAGNGISVTNAANSVTIDSTGGGLDWNVETGASTALLVNNGYIANRSGAQVDMTLPATAAVGSIIRVTGIDNATGWTISQNAGQTIHFGTSSTSTGVGGSLTSSATRDSVELLCVIADTDFNVLSSVGNITVV